MRNWRLCRRLLESDAPFGIVSSDDFPNNAPSTLTRNNIVDFTEP